MRTKKEIDALIAALIEIKPRVRRLSGFGDNHHDAIDAQIRVLEESMDNDRIYDEFEDGPQNVLDNANDALRWMEGEDQKILEDWQGLVS